MGENPSEGVIMATTSIRKRALIANGFAVMNSFGAMGGVALDFDQRFVWLAIVGAVGAGLYTVTLRCPRCGTPMMKRTARIFGMVFTYWGGFTIPKDCSQCGDRFD
jgi:hypothetical protein